MQQLNRDLRVLFAKAKMPTNPAIASEILKLSAQAESDATAFADLIRTDPALTTRFLKMANSVQFAQRTPVTSIIRAVTILGVNRVKTTALGFQLVSHLGRLGGVPFDMKEFWQHSLLRACVARNVASRLIRELEEEAFLVGLLQDCGILLMVQIHGSSYATLCRSGLSPAAFFTVEKDSFPNTHVNAISAMASEWNLPEIIAGPLTRHHEPTLLKANASTTDKLSAISYFVGNLQLSKELKAVTEDAGLREYAFEVLGISEADWQRIQDQAAKDYAANASLFGSMLPEEVDVSELLSEANHHLVAAAGDSDDRIVSVEVEKEAIQSEQKRLQSALRQYRERAALDPLTHVLNRGALTDGVRRAIDRNRDEGVSIAMLFLDVDNFKRLNDNYGHAIGDRVLKSVTSMLKSEIEPKGLVGRYGGEEFVVVLTGQSSNEVQAITEQILQKIRQLTPDSLGFPGNITCSAGLVWSERLPVDSAEAIYSAADQLMYKAKRAGKDQYFFEILKGSPPQVESGHPSAGTSESSDDGQDLADAGCDAKVQAMLEIARQLNSNQLDEFAGIRKQERKKVVAQCTMHYFVESGSDLRAEPAVTRNLSTGGIGILVQRPMVRGEPVEVVLDRGASKLFVAGLVTFCKHIDGSIHEVGVQFVAHSVTPILSGASAEPLQHDWVARALQSKSERACVPAF